MNLSEFLGALPIESASKITWELIASEGYDTLEKISTLTQAQIANIGKTTAKTIGDKRAAKIYNSFHSQYIQDLLVYTDKWVTADTNEPAQVTTSVSADSPLSALAGKNIVVTGTAPISRNELKKILESIGAKVQSAVSKTTDILLTESLDSTSSKAKAAKANGVKIMTYLEALPADIVH